MTDAIAVLSANGIKRPEVTIAAAKAAGLELAVACAMLIGESGGGRAVWGSDPVSTGGAYVKGGPVTEANYKAYRSLVKAGRIGRQGVGDSQLTSAEFQDRGDQLGGCWLPYPNQLSGFIGLANRVRQYGLRGGLKAYNGSGPAAERYADARMAQVAVWRRRLAGVTVPDVSATPEEDELNADQARQLDEVHDRVCRLENAWGGGRTDASGTPYDMRLLANRQNVDAYQALLAIQALTAKVDALAARIKP